LLVLFLMSSNSSARSKYTLLTVVSREYMRLFLTNGGSDAPQALQVCIFNLCTKSKGKHRGVSASQSVDVMAVYMEIEQLKEIGGALNRECKK